MSVYSAAKTLITAIKADATFVAYCTTNFSKQPTYFLGLDEESPPLNDSLPMVVIMPNSSNIVDNQHQAFSIGVGCACSDGTITAATGLTEYKGFETIENFSKALFAAIQRHYDEENSANTLYSLESWTELRIESYYPDYHSTREIGVISGL